MTRDALRTAERKAAERKAAERKAAERLGRRAEWIALAFLLCKGYRPLARRFSAAGGEIDLILRKGDSVVFVEVKARALMEDARVAITPAKRRRFSRAVRVWLSRNPWASALTLRADAVFLARRRAPSHLVDAFEIGLDQAAMR